MNLLKATLHLSFWVTVSEAFFINHYPWKHHQAKPRPTYMMSTPTPTPDAASMLEAERIMRQLEQGAITDINTLQDTGSNIKYMPSTDPNDPIVQALQVVLGTGQVQEFELLDSRWNGNEVFKYKTEKGLYFLKLNRVEDPSVFMSEAVGLSAIARTNTIRCPKPLHLGKLPKVGDIGPGAFMILEYIPLIPFGIMRADFQRQLGEQLAAMHTSNVHDELHRGRFGFPVSNFLSLTPLNNTWHKDWPTFFQTRIHDQILALYKDKQYGRKVLLEEDSAMLEKGQKVMERIPDYFKGLTIRPSLIHGDLWVGNAGATKEVPVVFDPACFFGHSEMELAITKMFGGLRNDFYDSYHSILPKEAGYEEREKLYMLYYYLNQLNLFGDGGVKATCLRLCDEILADGR